jgi:4-aminobutyrate aminotransferase-like enzyme
MIGIELIRNPETKGPALKERGAILVSAFKEGLTLLPAGESVIRFCPLLILERRHIDTAVGILDHVLRTEGF